MEEKGKNSEEMRRDEYKSKIIILLSENQSASENVKVIYRY